MSRDRDHRTFQDKLKQMFKITKSNPGNLVLNREIILTDVLLRDLGKDSPTTARLRAMKDLGDRVQTCKLENNGVERLWSCMQDMFLSEYSNEVRHAAFNFLNSLIKGQSDCVGMMRAQFFRFIKHHDNPHDLGQRVDLLCSLTNDGKDVEHFEEEIGPFLLGWMDDVQRVGKLLEYLRIVDNVIKFNSPHLDDGIMIDYVRHLCDLCCNSNQYAVVILCLQILGTVVAYSILPPQSLPQFVGTLCRTVNVKCYCNASWKTMKNLLGTHMGHSTLFMMCRLLQEPNLRNDAGIIRGCVFYIHMALWDATSMQNLCCPPSSVLPAIHQAVECEHLTVSYEVILGIHKLVTKAGSKLMEPSWDNVLEIILMIIKQIEANPGEQAADFIRESLRETLTSVENLIDAGYYKGSAKKFYAVIHECVHDRPESSVLKLMHYQTESIRPNEHTWLSNLNHLLLNYFRPDMRTNIRLKVLNVLTDVIKSYRQYEDELINRILIPHIQQIANDDNPIIRAQVAKLLVDLSLGCTKFSVDLLEIIEKLLLRPFDKIPHEIVDLNEVLDINILIPGLITIFAKKMHRLPTGHPIKVLKVLLKFLDKHFQNVTVFKNLQQHRQWIFEFILKFRADSKFRLCFPDVISGKLKHSPYICVTYRNMETHVSSPPPFAPIATAINMDEVFKSIISSVEKEHEWDVLKVVLDGIPGFFANKAIVLAKHGNNDVNKLLQLLCFKLEGKNVPDIFMGKVSRMEFQTSVVASLQAMSSYGNILDQYHQQDLINTLSKSIGADPRCSKQTINALTICMVDMRETMMKLLPDVLVKLSKISATTTIAMPVLQFLSTLSQLPTVYANFVCDQYMAVFAIALPFTNPFKYDHYVVCMAYHVIAVWFLKCRLPFRRDFVKFIVSGLRTNVMSPFPELSQFNKSALAALNQDSSDRKRSSSLTEQSSRKRAVADSTKGSNYMQNMARDRTVLTFYEELNETCIDLMARYTYSPCSALPERLPTADFLLTGGISKSWMVGNKLITVTTSGCTQKVLKHGVCDKCLSRCGFHDESALYTRSNSGGDDGAVGTSRRSSGDDGKKSSSSDSGSGGLLPKNANDERKEIPLCACWCQGWAEIYIRRPTGNVSWVMKVQNKTSFKQTILDFPLNEMSTLFMPSMRLLDPKPSASLDARVLGLDDEESLEAKNPLSRHSSKDSDDEDIDYDDGAKSRNPVRRSNSSPEMANWKNPFSVNQKSEMNDEASCLDDEQTKKKKDRVSCEAIPEEMGTSPPTDTVLQLAHPSLLTCHSYPGSSPPADSAIPAKLCKTVPPSPSPTVIVPSDDEKCAERPTKLANLTPLVTSKPPQSPTQTSPRLARHLLDKDGLPIQKSSSSSKLEKSKAGKGFPSDLSMLGEKRERLNTISGLPTRAAKTAKKALKETLKSGMNPSFVFLQLYHTASFGNPNEVPLVVHSTEQIKRAVNILDRMYPFEVHKIGVIYIGEGQVDKEADILKNSFGSLRYMEFLQNLGTLIRLTDADPQTTFLGGLDHKGSNGQYMYTHLDDLVMLAFHVATLMPNREGDAYCTHKKSHIGNDNVLIIYNDSGEKFNIATFKSQVTVAYIIIEPLDYNCNRVEIKAKLDNLNINPVNEEMIVSDQSVSILVRQLAIHADLAATVLNSLRSHSADPYASNWLERLRKLKMLRAKVIDEIKKRKDEVKGFSDDTDSVQDFTDFT